MEGVNEVPIEQAEVDHEFPEAQPGTLLRDDYDVLLAGFGMSILLSLSSFVEGAPVLTICIVAVHVLLFHFILIIKESHEEVSFLSHGLYVVSELVPVLASSS